MSLLPVVRGITRGYTNLQHGWHYRPPRTFKRPRLEPVEEPTEGTINMGKRTFTKLRYRRKKKSKRRYGRRRYRQITNTWPRTRLVKFRVVDSFSASTAAGQLSISNIKVNSLNDPLATVSANLPLGLDQWAAMYKRYTVVSAKVYAKVHNVTSTGAVAFGLTLRQPEESSALASLPYYMECPMTRSKILSPDVDHAGLGITYRAKPYWNVKSFRDHEELAGDLSTTPGDPAKLAYVQYWAGDVNNTDAFTLEGYLTVEYVVLLSDPVTPARSSL